MKIRYFSTLAVVMLVASLGTIMGCAQPCAAKNDTPAASSASQVVDPCAGKANPCAAKADPCAGKANPCAAKADPCASKANPCAAKADPCASKANPCAGKMATLAPLAPELQGKPVVVDVFATWCAACKNIAPTLARLETEYEGIVNFVVLDVTDKSTLAEAEAKAAKLGLTEFLAANKSQTGMLTIIDPDSGTILAQHRNNPNFADYQTVLDAALNQ